MHQQLGRATSQQPFLGRRLDWLQQGEGQTSPQRGGLLPLSLPALWLQRPVEGQLQLSLLQPPRSPSTGVRFLLGVLLRLLLLQPLGQLVLPIQALQRGQQLSDLLWEQGDTLGEGSSPARWGRRRG